MNKKSWMMTLAACTASLISFSAAGYDLGSSEVIAKYTSEPITLDGKLDEGAWANAPVYSLYLPFKAYATAPESMQKNIGDNLACFKSPVDTFHVTGHEMTSIF